MTSPLQFPPSAVSLATNGEIQERTLHHDPSESTPPVSNYLQVSTLPHHTSHSPSHPHPPADQDASSTAPFQLQTPASASPPPTHPSSQPSPLLTIVSTPHVLTATGTKLTNPAQMVIDPDILPMPRRRMIHLVHDTQMRMRRRDRVPPVPRPAVRRAVGKGLEVLARAKVDEHHGLVCVVLLARVEPGCVA